MFSYCCQTRNTDVAKAIGILQYGDIKKVVRMKKIFLPSLSERQVLIEIKAICLSSVECNLIRNAYEGKININFPYVLGREFAGIIIEKGVKSTFRKGDYVFGFVPIQSNGALSEYYIASDDTIAIMPRNYTFDQAVLYPFQVIAGLRITEKIQLSRKTKLLISDPTLSISIFLIPLIKEANAHITCIVYDAQNPVIKTLPIDDFIVIESDSIDIAKYKKEFDIVIDYGTFGDLLLVTVKPGGLFLTVDIPLRKYPDTALSINYLHLPIIPKKDDLKKATEIINQKRITLPTPKKFEFLDIIDALEYFRKQNFSLKIVITVDSKSIKKAIQDIENKKLQRERETQISQINTSSSKNSLILSKSPSIISQP